MQFNEMSISGETYSIHVRYIPGKTY